MVVIIAVLFFCCSVAGMRRWAGHGGIFHGGFAVCKGVGIGAEEEKANIEERGRESRPGSVGWSVGA